jgi:hypothetical protein
MASTLFAFDDYTSECLKAWQPVSATDVSDCKETNQIREKQPLSVTWLQMNPSNRSTLL